MKTKLVTLAVFFLIAGSLAAAQAAAERPWAAEVAPDRQTQALKIFEEANALFAESKYVPALARYREALQAWDHPAIRYNTAVALIQLDQPLAAYENLEAALRYGNAPFDSENYKQALLYQKLLAGQLSELEVVCEEVGAEVTLDGEVLFVGPGSHKRRLVPGTHQLVAQKTGLMTETRPLQLPPGKLTSERIELKPFVAAPVRMVRRWAVWKPWAAVGAGVVTTLVGVPFMLSARSNLNSFDSDLARLCPSGCTTKALPQTVVDAKDRGRQQNRFAVGFFAVGGAVTAAGAVLLLMNQPHPEDPSVPELDVVPMVSTDTVGMSGTLRF